MVPEPSLRIDLQSPIPVYRQVADQMRTLMVEGRLRAGEQVPTVRELAVDLGVHHNTIAQAYRELAAEGWLDLRRRRGAVVRVRPVPTPTEEATAAFAGQLRQLVAKARAQGIDRTVLATILADTRHALIAGTSHPSDETIAE